MLTAKILVCMCIAGAVTFAGSASTEQDELQAELDATDRLIELYEKRRKLLEQRKGLPKHSGDSGLVNAAIDAATGDIDEHADGTAAATAHRVAAPISQVQQSDGQLQFVEAFIERNVATSTAGTDNAIIGLFGCEFEANSSSAARKAATQTHAPLRVFLQLWKDGTTAAFTERPDDAITVSSFWAGSLADGATPPPRVIVAASYGFMVDPTVAVLDGQGRLYLSTPMLSAGGVPLSRLHGKRPVLSPHHAAPESAPAGSQGDATHNAALTLAIDFILQCEVEGGDETRGVSLYSYAAEKGNAVSAVYVGTVAGGVRVYDRHCTQLRVYQVGTATQPVLAFARMGSTLAVSSGTTIGFISLHATEMTGVYCEVPRLSLDSGVEGGMGVVDSSQAQLWVRALTYDGTHQSLLWAVDGAGMLYGFSPRSRSARDKTCTLVHRVAISTAGEDPTHPHMTQLFGTRAHLIVVTPQQLTVYNTSLAGNGQRLQILLKHPFAAAVKQKQVVLQANDTLPQLEQVSPSTGVPGDWYPLKHIASGNFAVERPQSRSKGGMWSAFFGSDAAIPPRDPLIALYLPLQGRSVVLANMLATPTKPASATLDVMTNLRLPLIMGGIGIIVYLQFQRRHAMHNEEVEGAPQPTFISRLLAMFGVGLGAVNRGPLGMAARSFQSNSNANVQLASALYGAGGKLPTNPTDIDAMLGRLVEQSRFRRDKGLRSAQQRRSSRVRWRDEAPAPVASYDNDAYGVARDASGSEGGEEEEGYTGASTIAGVLRGDTSSDSAPDDQYDEYQGGGGGSRGYGVHRSGARRETASGSARGLRVGGGVSGRLGHLGHGMAGQGIGRQAPFSTSGRHQAGSSSVGYSAAQSQQWPQVSVRQQQSSSGPSRWAASLLSLEQTAASRGESGYGRTGDDDRSGESQSEGEARARRMVAALRKRADRLSPSIVEPEEVFHDDDDDGGGGGREEDGAVPDGTANDVVGRREIDSGVVDPDTLD